MAADAAARRTTGSRYLSIRYTERLAAASNLR